MTAPNPDAGIPITLEVTSSPMPEPGGGGHLPTTGTDVASIVVIGLVLVVTGAVIAVAARRRPPVPGRPGPASVRLHEGRAR